MNESGPLLRAEHVSKRFGNVTALDDVTLDVTAGRVTCLLGDNGAGKSTLIRILAGVHRPSAGMYFVDGEAVTFDSPRQAQARGIATVHQDLALIPLMSIWRNFFLGAEPVRGAAPFRRIDVNLCRTMVRHSLGQLGIDVRDPDQPVGTLSGGERQCVAIARAIHVGARVIILDEPTAALGVKQSGEVLHLLANARDRGLAILLITHNPHHAYAIGDRFVVLRRGRVEGTFARTDLALAELVRWMAGGEDMERLGRELAR
ncbi:MAG: ATP-binding cassette domain-containing protein [Longimicrobiales bacterium]